MTEQMKQARDEKARTYGYNNAIYIDKAMLSKEGYQYLEEKPAKDFTEGTDWYRNNVWHDAKKEKPVYYDDDSHTNQIVVIGNTPVGVGMSVVSLISEDTIYSIVTRKEYKWGCCPFSKWAYMEDLLPTEGYKEF